METFIPIVINSKCYGFLRDPVSHLSLYQHT